MSGYSHNFLGKSHVVTYPDYSYYHNDIAKNQDTEDYVLDYIYYSVVQSKSRRLPILSASNIYRTEFQQTERIGSFKSDRRIYDYEQLSTKDYTRFNSIKSQAIEKGHMTKREDVQWDVEGDKERAIEAAKSTFFYPNAVPQHDSLNNGLWKHLENSIMIKGRVEIPAKVSVFTGPVLDENDPLFKVKLHDDTNFQIPALFWKVVYYVKPDKNLYYAGFLMGQVNPLRRDKLIADRRFRDFVPSRTDKTLKPFLEFEEDEKYQVPITLIEELTHLSFCEAIDLHKDIKPTKLKLKNFQIRSFQSSISPEEKNSTLVEGLIV